MRRNSSGCGLRHTEQRFKEIEKIEVLQFGLCIFSECFICASAYLTGRDVVLFWMQNYCSKPNYYPNSQNNSKFSVNIETKLGAGRPRKRSLMPGRDQDIATNTNKRTHAHGAEPFLTSRQLCSYSRNSQHFMVPKNLLLCSQEPSAGPYPEPHQPNPYLPIVSKIRCNIAHLSTCWGSQWSLTFWLSHQYPICIALLPHSCYVPCTAHPP
jgi:hypothetical protein